MTFIYIWSSSDNSLYQLLAFIISQCTSSIISSQQPSSLIGLHQSAAFIIQHHLSVGSFGHSAAFVYQ
jgi:hypothetical protein